MAIVKKPSIVASKKYDKRVSDKMSDMLNMQIEVELEAAQIYKAMASWAEINGYFGTAKFMQDHYKEELDHMDKMYQYILDRNCLAITPEIKQPKLEFSSLYELIKEAYKHEKYVTSTYNEVSMLALKENDYVTFHFIGWYLEEQIEEEMLFSRVLDQYDVLAQSGELTGLSLFEWDNEIGKLVNNKK